VARLILRRLVLAVVTLLVLSFIVFAATQVLPGDAAQAILGKSATPARLAALREQLHSDRPAVEQYRLWIEGLARGDLGDSLASGQPVWTLLSGRVLNSAILLVAAGTLGTLLGMAVGALAAVRRDRFTDHVVTGITLALVALPEFVVGVLLAFVFGTSLLHLLPPVSLLLPDQSRLSQLSAFILPTLTLTIAIFPYISRMMRASMVEVLESDYVEMAHLKGIRDRLVLTRYALRNAIVPTLQVTALQIAWLAGGVVLVEFVFQYPGIGMTLVDAVANRDIPVVQAVTMLVAGIYVLLNLGADLATIFLTPRLRTEARS
jgi:peptide/nickel transport system permease protein